MTRFSFFLILKVFLAVGVFSVPALSGDDDHDQARAALQRGEIKPLHEIIAMVQKTMPGEVIEVEFERDDGLWIYEIKMIGNGGRFMKVFVDAANNSIIRVKMKHAHSHRRR